MDQRSQQCDEPFGPRQDEVSSRFYSGRRVMGAAWLRRDGTVAVSPRLEPAIHEPRYDPVLDRHLTPSDGEVWLSAVLAIFPRWPFGARRFLAAKSASFIPSGACPNPE